MRKWYAWGAAVLAVALLGAGHAFADGDVAAGKKAFNKCVSCHDAKADKVKLGPSLLGVIGRTAGTLPSFAGKFSEPMKAAGAAGLIWDDASLAAFLKAPKETVPGNKMAFPGLKQDQEIADVIAYLKADPKP